MGIKEWWEGGGRREAVVSCEEYRRVMERKLKDAAVVMLLPGMKLGIWSDAHESDGSPNDNYKENIDMMEDALREHYRQGYRDFMLGDWVDLIEKWWRQVKRYGRNALMFHWWRQVLLWVVPGNHDRYIRRIKDEWLEGVSFADAIIIKDRTGRIIADCSHGHEADVYNKGGRWTNFVNRVVRYVWVPIEFIVNSIVKRRGINHEEHEEARRKRESSPALNKEKAGALDKVYMWWARVKDRWVLRGHTHRVMMIPIGDGENLTTKGTKEEEEKRYSAGYANAGTCSGKNHATGLELECFMDGKIELRAVWWDEKGRHEALINTI